MQLWNQFLGFFADFSLNEIYWAIFMVYASLAYIINFISLAAWYGITNQRDEEDNDYLPLLLIIFSPITFPGVIFWLLSEVFAWLVNSLKDYNSDD